MAVLIGLYSCGVIAVVVVVVVVIAEARLENFENSMDNLRSRLVEELWKHFKAIDRVLIAYLKG